MNQPKKKCNLYLAKKTQYTDIISEVHNAGISIMMIHNRHMR